MITGDFPSHEVWGQSREWNLAHSKMMSDMVSEIFPDSLILPSMGNHESFPCNRFALKHDLLYCLQKLDNIMYLHGSTLTLSKKSLILIQLG